MAGHTPGPWQWNGDFHEIQAAGGETVVAMVNERGTGWYLVSLEAPEPIEAGANARLIERAPQLFELVKNLRHLVQVCDAAAATGYEDEFLAADGGYWMALARTTIKEIDGREP